jgi:NTP pyrophosphatase (non-canonical NTP hydrolase)
MNFTVNEIQVVTRAIKNWADSIMPERTPADAIKKLSMEEVPELWRSLKENGEVDEGEIADVLILALDICAMSDIDPMDAIHQKMAINIGRKWKFEYGVLQHED